MADQRRLHVARVTIEFEFAFVAIPGSSDVARAAREQLRSALADVDAQGFSDIKVHEAPSRQYQPLEAGDEDDVVYGVFDRLGNPVRWRDAVENDKRLRNEEVLRG